MSIARRLGRWLLPPVALALTAALAVTIAPPIQVTEASWIDAQSAGGRLTAGSMDVPVIASCAVENSGPIGELSSVTVTWTSVLQETDWMAVKIANAGQTHLVPKERISRSGPSGGLYTYSFTESGAALTASLGPLTNVQLIVSVGTRAGSNWASASDARQTVAVGALGVGQGSGTCDLVHELSFAKPVAATAPIERVIPVGTPQTSSLPAALQDRRRTSEFSVTLHLRGTTTPVPNTQVTLVLPAGLTFETGPNMGNNRGNFTTNADGIVKFRVVGNGFLPAGGVVRVESDRAFSVQSGATVHSVPLVAWGYAPNGETGSDFSGVARTSAVPLWDNLDISAATALGSTYSGLFYADQNRKLWARGYNASGTLGDGTATIQRTVVPALTAPGQQLGDIVYIGTGTDQLSSVAVDSLGGVWATGDAEYSGFGPGYTNTRFWQRVSDRYANMPAGVGAISAEVNPWGNVLMVLTDGRAMVTGPDIYGYAAQGANVSESQGRNGLLMLTAPGVPITGVTSGSLGWESSAVVTADGKLYTAGAANYGGSGTRYLVEKELPAGKVADRVMVRQYRIMVLMTDGSIYALGANTSGSQGTGTSASPGETMTPVVLPANSKVVDFSLGNDTSLFLLSDGTV